MRVWIEERRLLPVVGLGTQETVGGEQYGVVVHHGNPGPESGHYAVGASSYFDRFWSASRQTARFFVQVVKC